MTEMRTIPPQPDAAGADVAAAAPSGAPFAWPVRVYWEDTDAGGIVYYANYLRFLERARTEWLRAAGIEQLPLRERCGVIFAVVEVEAKYLRPARYGELLQVTCAVDAAARASLRFVQRIYRGNLQGELLLQARVRIACLDALEYRPRPLPPALLREIRE